MNPIKLFNMKPLQGVFMWLALTFYASNGTCQTAFHSFPRWKTTHGAQQYL